MHYQLTYLIPSDVSDLKTLEEIIADVNKKITDAGGIIKKPLVRTEDQPVTDKNAVDLEKIKESQNVRVFKHRLGYPIKKVSYGFYVSIIYELPEKNQSAMTKKIDAEIRLNKKIVRFVTTKYNFKAFSEQANQKEKVKTIKVPEKIKQKESEPLQNIINEEVAAKKEEPAHKKEKKEIVLDEKPKKSKKTEIEELDEKLEQILNS